MLASLTMVVISCRVRVAPLQPSNGTSSSRARVRFFVASLLLVDDVFRLHFFA